MKYFQVNTGDKYDYFTGHTTIKGELLTQKERDTKFRYLNDEFFTPVEVSKRDIYWSFGARFKYGMRQGELIDN